MRIGAVAALADVDLRPEARMIGVGMRDDARAERGATDRYEIARGAIEAAIGRNDKVHGKNGRLERLRRRTA